jgi:hypothetical protein
MGYRSQVAFAVSHKVKNMILAKAQKELTGDDLEFVVDTMSGKDVDEYAENEHGIFARHDGIKWYESDPAVRLIEKVIGSLPSESRFMRLGEDMGDYEEQGSFEQVKRITLVRHIQATNV